MPGSLDGAARSVDMGLPLVDAALDIVGMNRALASTISAVGGRAPRLLGARVIDLKPGRRASIAYEVEGDEGHIFAKHFSDPNRGRRVHRVLVGLGRALQARGASVAIPEPLAWIEEPPVLLYRPARGRSLSDAIAAGEPDGASVLGEVGRCLAEMHDCSLELDRRFDLDNETTNLRAWAQIVAAACPEDGRCAPALAETVAGALRALRLEAGAPIHKDFRPGHVLVGSGVSFIDFDEMRWGEPSFDLAHFCTYLHLLGLRKSLPTVRMEMLRRAFLEGHERRSSCGREGFAAFGIYACLKIAWQMCSGDGVRSVPAGGELRRQLRAILQHGQELGETL
ncbi:MAG: phosphotransferase family protein [Actinomycetota bacterium]